jgi:cytochrome subunit of sulfide dehydrogenase
MAKRSRPLALLAGALALGVGMVTQAADAPANAALVSGASGRMLAEACAGCHGTDGASAGPAIPTIAGMNTDYFIALMRGFRDGKVYSTVMGRISTGYTGDEIALLAKYFNGKPYVAAAQTFDESLVAKGKTLHDKYCEKCHTKGGTIVKGDEPGEEDEYHILAGQWTPYLENAMNDFREGRREMAKKMKSKLEELRVREGDAGLKAIFAFYASEK